MELLTLERVSNTAKMPIYGSDQAACFDLRVDSKSLKSKFKDGTIQTSSSFSIMPGERVLLPTGFIFHIADGYQLKINPRSGLAWKHGITVLNAPATIDSDYKGELFIVLYNAGSETFVVKHGDRIAQAEIVPALRVNLESLGERKGGLGSSGVA